MVNITPLSGILQGLKETVESSSAISLISLINVRRSAVLEDACRHIQRKKFNPSARISVRFADDSGSSEGAVDAGGPRREFLRLLLKSINEDSGIFVGPLHSRILQANSAGMQFVNREHPNQLVSCSFRFHV